MDFDTTHPANLINYEDSRGMFALLDPCHRPIRSMWGMSAEARLREWADKNGYTIKREMTYDEWSAEFLR